MRRMIWIVMAAGLLVSGCQKPVIEKPMVLTDGTGRKYLVQHHIGGTYTVTPIPEE